MKKYHLVLIAFAIFVILTACSKNKPKEPTVSLDDNSNHASASDDLKEDSSVSGDKDSMHKDRTPGEYSVSGQNVIYHAADGVSIDFGCLLEEGAEVTVEKVEPAPIDEDVAIYAYNISLSSGQPNGAIEIVIPYDDTGLNKEEEHLSVCGKYLNEKTNQWEDVFYTVDTEANEVHIFTDHLSNFSVFTFTNSKKRNEYISEVNSYAVTMPNERALFILDTYAKQGFNWQAEVIGAYLDTSDTLPAYLLTNASTLLSLGEAYDSLISKPIQNAMTGLSISTACTQLAYSLYMNGIHTPQTATTAMKSALSVAINFATPSIKLAYFGVGIVDIALMEVKTFAIAERYRSTKNMYDAYYKRKEIHRSFLDWKDLFDKIYKKTKETPQIALDLMKGEIDTYVNAYWKVAAVDWESWIDSYDKNGNASKYPWPSEADRKNISETHKRSIYVDLQALFNQMYRNIYLDCLITRQSEYEKLASYFNQQYSVVIREDIPSGKNATWAGYYVRFAPLSSDADPYSWTGTLDKEGSGRISFTLLAHKKAGFPKILELYRTKADVESGNKLRTITLKPFIDREQTVILEPRIIEEAKDIEEEDQTPIDDNGPKDDSSGSKPEKEDSPKEDPPKDNPPKEDPPKKNQPVRVNNPWYDVTIVSQDAERPNAFAGWYAVLAYPQDMEVSLQDMYGSFNLAGKCTIYFQESDYDALDRPSRIWLYSDVTDLLNKKKPNVTATFSIASGSYEGERDGQAVYSVLVRAKPPVQKKDPLDEINGYYSSYMEYSEQFIPGEGMMQIDNKKSYAPYEKPSGEAWLHYNGPSLTYKSMQDPYLTEHVLEKQSDSRYEIVYNENGTKMIHSIIIYSPGQSAQYTYSSETENGTKYLARYYLYK